MTKEEKREAIIAHCDAWGACKTGKVYPCPLFGGLCYSGGADIEGNYEKLVKAGLIKPDDEVDRKNDEIEFVKVEREALDGSGDGEVDFSYMGCWWRLWQFMRRNRLSKDERHLFSLCQLALTKAAAYENLAADMQELLLDHCANCKDNDTYFCHSKCKWHDYDTDYPFERAGGNDDGRST